MHTPFDSNLVDWRGLIASNTLVDPMIMYGGGGSFVFKGMPYQRGAGIGSVFRSLFRYLLPLGRKAGEAIGRQGLESGIHVLSDVLDGRNLQDSAIQHGREGARNLLNKASAQLTAQKGNGNRLRKDINRKSKIGQLTAIDSNNNPSSSSLPIINDDFTTALVKSRLKTTTARQRRKRLGARKQKYPRKKTTTLRKGKRKIRRGIIKRRRDALGFY